MPIRPGIKRPMFKARYAIPAVAIIAETALFAGSRIGTGDFNAAERANGATASAIGSVSAWTVAEPGEGAFCNVVSAGKWTKDCVNTGAGKIKRNIGFASDNVTDNVSGGDGSGDGEQQAETDEDPDIDMIKRYEALGFSCKDTVIVDAVEDDGLIDLMVAAGTDFELADGDAYELGAYDSIELFPNDTVRVGDCS